mmetsp:Transcript_7258/g.14391  ORF Transcript_7258/g.14391 Transcript_7258/m.14391 type:complete len:104 (+) Transcript_7258:254-565(+)
MRPAVVALLFPWLPVPPAMTTLAASQVERGLQLHGSVLPPHVRVALYFRSCHQSRGGSRLRCRRQEQLPTAVQAILMNYLQLRQAARAAGEEGHVGPPAGSLP